MPIPSQWLVNGPARAKWTIALAHGAGAPMDSPFMAEIADRCATANLRCIRFEFPYMARRRTEGVRPGPDRAPVLEKYWNDVIATIGNPERLIIGGKSMGGRIASHIADQSAVAGLVCLGYPFHPPGRPEKTRTAHLAGLVTPTLILQGERDTLGTPADVAGYALSPSIKVTWLPDGDHSFKPRKKSGHTLPENMAAAVAGIVEFAAGL